LDAPARASALRRNLDLHRPGAAALEVMKGLVDRFGYFRRV